MNNVRNKFTALTYLVTGNISGTSPGRRIAYETPLKVVPTSNPITIPRESPVYGSRRSNWTYEEAMFASLRLLALVEDVSGDGACT